MLMNQQAAGRVAKARDDAMEAERIRQRGFQQEMQPINDQARERYTGFEGQRTEKAQQLGDYFAANAPTTGQSAAPTETPTSVGAGAGNTVVDNELSRRLQEARAYGQQQDKALGNLRAFGDVLGGIGVKQARDAGQIAQIGGFSKASSDLLPGDLEAANSKGGSGLLGDVLNLGGLVTIGAGLAGAGPGFGDIFGPGASKGAAFTARSTGLSNAPGGFGFGAPY